MNGVTEKDVVELLKGAANRFHASYKKAEIAAAIRALSAEPQSGGAAE